MNKRQVGAWALFDFANSVYPAVIVSVVFQIYFIEAIVGNEAGEGDAWWGRAVSLSALIVALSAPVLGAVADRAGVRKRFMALCVAMCITGVVLFATLEPGMVLYGFVVFLIANVGFAIGTGTDVAIESADITLMRGSLHGLADAVAVSKATLRNIKQNLFGAFIYNVAGIPFAAGVLYPFLGILLSPVIAGAAMAFSSLTVVSNANRLRFFKAKSH